MTALGDLPFVPYRLPALSLLPGETPQGRAAKDYDGLGMSNKKLYT